MGGRHQERVDLRHRAIDPPGAAHGAPLGDEFVAGSGELAGLGSGGFVRSAFHFVFSNTSETTGWQAQFYRLPRSGRAPGRARRAAGSAPVQHWFKEK